MNRIIWFFFIFSYLTQASYIGKKSIQSNTLTKIASSNTIKITDGYNIKLFIPDNNCSQQARVLIFLDSNNKIVWRNTQAIPNKNDYQMDPFDKIFYNDKNLQLAFSYGSIIYLDYLFNFIQDKNKFILQSIKLRAFNKRNPNIYIDTKYKIKPNISLKDFNASKYLKSPIIPLNILELEQTIKKIKEPYLYNIIFFKSFLNEFPLTPKTLTKYNNIAYYLQKEGANKEAVFLLEKIIKKFPNRTVAYYNLGDAYWALGEKDKAIKAYTTYIEQMCDKGLQKKVPKEILERMK